MLASPGAGDEEQAPFALDIEVVRALVFRRRGDGGRRWYLLRDILDGPEAVKVRAELATAFAGRGGGACKPGCWPTTECDPNCNPTCQPSCNPHCQPTCSPRCSPTCDPISCKPNQCWPRY